MGFGYARQAISLSIVAVIAICFLLTQAVAAAQPVNWMSGTPTIRELQTITAPTYGNRRCAMTNLNVVRQYVPHDETHCMIQTSYGLIANDLAVIQPPGYSRAYPVDIGSSYGMFIPIPNHPGVLKTGNGGFSAGNSLGMYTNFFDTLQISAVGTSPRFIQTGEPDQYFRYPNGSYRQLNVGGTIAFAENGRYFVVDDVREGYLKVNTSTLEVTEFANTQPYNLSASNYFAGANAIDSDGVMAVQAYNAPQDWGAKYFNIIDSKNCTATTGNPGYGISNRNCPNRNVYSNLQQAIPELKTIDKVQIPNERTMVVDVTVAGAGGNVFKRYSVAAPNQTERSLEYLALGDSFAAGQGAGSYRDGTDMALNRCHQSAVSYPYLFANQFSSSASVACSGAKLHNIIFNNDAGKRPSQLTANREADSAEVSYAYEYGLPGYMQQYNFVKRTKPSVLTVSIGGNDIGFADKIVACAAPELDNVSTCFPTYEDRVEIVKSVNDRLPRLRDTFRTLLDSDPERKLYVIGYPQIAKPGGNCGANVQMNEAELRGAEDLITYLNQIIKLAANEAGAYFVDVEDAFTGHRLCETTSDKIAVNGVSLTFDQGKFVDAVESFHPNILGHELLAADIRQKTQNFTKPMPTAVQTATLPQNLPVNDSIDFLKDIPQTGRIIRDIFLDTPDLLTPVYVEIPQTFASNSIDAMLKPSSDYSFELHSNPVSLGTFTSDSVGNLQASYTIPKDVTPGFHTLHIYGQDIFGNSIDIQKQLYVAASEDDIDGDGVPNDQDECVGNQSMEDADKDKIPDSCDPYIGDLPLVSPADQTLAPTGAPPTIGSAQQVQGRVLSALTQLGVGQLSKDTPAYAASWPTKEHKGVGSSTRNLASQNKTKTHDNMTASVVAGILACLLLLLVVRKVYN